MADPKAPQRSELAKFLPDSRAVRAFELLFNRVGSEIPDEITTIIASIQELALSAGSAESRAQAAIDSLAAFARMTESNADLMRVQAVVDVLTGAMQDVTVLAGSAGAKAQSASDDAAMRVRRSGDTMTGDLSVDRTGQATPARVTVSADDGYAAGFSFHRAGITRGVLYFTGGVDRLSLTMLDAAGANAQNQIVTNYGANTTIRYAGSDRVDTAVHGADVTGVATQSRQIVTGVNGATVQISDYVAQVQYIHGTVIAAHTLTFPAAPIDKQRMRISAGAGAVTALTLAPSGAETIRGAPAALAADGFAEWQYRLADTTWYRTG